MTDENLEVVKLTIVRTVDPEGRYGLAFQHQPPEISFIETLGMLDAARWHVYSSMEKFYGGDL